LLLLLSEHLYSALSLNKIPNALHGLCQYVANRKEKQCLKESKVSVLTVKYSGRLFHADGPAQENALLNHHMRAGKPSQYVTSHPSQLSLCGQAQ